MKLVHTLEVTCEECGCSLTFQRKTPVESRLSLSEEGAAAPPTNWVKIDWQEPIMPGVNRLCTKYLCNDCSSKPDEELLNAVEGERKSIVRG